MEEVWQTEHHAAVQRNVFVFTTGKITYTLKDKQEVFQKVGGGYIGYIKNNDLSEILNEIGTE